LHCHRGQRPVKVRWIQSSLCLHLFPISFGFGISFVHIKNFFITTDILLWKKPFQCEQPCVLAARGGTKTPDDVVCYLGTEHSPGPTVDFWSRCSSCSRTTKFDKNRSRPYLWRDFCALQDWTGSRHTLQIQCVRGRRCCYLHYGSLPLAFGTASTNWIP
jgi:hypothetical protein